MFLVCLGLIVIVSIMLSCHWFGYAQLSQLINLNPVYILFANLSIMQIFISDNTIEEHLSNSAQEEEISVSIIIKILHY